jgi:hypothetical protein
MHKRLTLIFLAYFYIIFCFWAVNSVNSHEGTEEQHTYSTPPAGMDVPTKGTTNDFWAEWFGPHPYIDEPNKKFITKWEINEVPRNVTVYYDVNDDGFNDMVFAHPIVAENHAPACDHPRPEQAHHWMFTTCPMTHAADYFVVREYTMFRIINQYTCSGCPQK